MATTGAFLKALSRLGKRAAYVLFVLNLVHGCCCAQAATQRQDAALASKEVTAEREALRAAATEMNNRQAGVIDTMLQVRVLKGSEWLKINVFLHRMSRVVQPAQ